MEGANGGEDARGGGWGGSGGYDATNQIKQLLRISTEDSGKACSDKPHTPLQRTPVQKQENTIQSCHTIEKPGNPSNKQQTWEAHRFQDSRRRVDSPCGNNPRHGNFDQNRNPPHRNYDNRHADNYGSPNRSTHRQGNYESGFSGNHRNQHHYQSHHHRGMGASPRDNKDLRMNGPRHLGSPHNLQITLGSETESPEFRPSLEVLAELEEQFLYPLKKKSIRFPKAKYFCRLCDYHCDSLVVCKRHITDTRHRKLKEAKDLETTLKNVPTPTDAQIMAIDRLVNSISDQVKVSPDMVKTRRQVVAELNEELVSRVKGCRLEMVGSSVSRFCLRTSDVNIDIVMDGNLSPSTALLAVKELVGNSDIYKDVVDDLSSSFPTMSFTHSKTSLRMVVGASSTSSKYTNQLLEDYSSMDPRVPILGVVFRYWAQLCQIDDQARGTLPPHTFPVMLVHFLQQHQPPVLPVLHLLHPNPDGDVYLRAADVGDKWQSKNSQCVGKLWLEMFRFYTIGFRLTDLVVNVRQQQPMTKAEKTWSKKIAVEDPFLQKRNLTRTVSGNPVFEYIMDRFKTTYKYFAIPQLSYGPLFLHIIVKEMSSGTKAAENIGQRNRKGEILLESIEKAGQSQSEASSECEMERTEEEAEVTVEGDDVDEDDDTTNMSGFEADLSTISLEETVEEPVDCVSPNGLSSQEEEVSETSLEELTTTIPFVTPSQAAKLMLQVKDDYLHFRFEEQFFTQGQKPPLICGSCQKDGHCKADCREDDLPPLKRLPPINNHFLNQLSAIFEQLTRDFEPSVQEIDERDKIVSDLENYIRVFFQGVSLKLFGSSANGFGFQRSDLDICLTFEGNPTGQNIDHIKIIEQLAEKLKRYRQCGHVFAITTAKVPIVKFSIRRAYLEGDLSLYNTLALQNTKLLYTYAKIDHRVKCLGYAMKYFAKLCDIGDASRGSLSSYAYILMVLHFLQQCKPPVVPVLQELYDHSKPAPQLTIDGWNAWFYDDLDSLKKVWKDYGKNQDTVGQLWVNMLRYYTETFNWKDHVVTIRQLAPLTRLQKLWNSRCIAIEDPFDLSHNLGAGLSRKMNTFIMKAFIRGREVFGTAVMGYPPGYRHLVDYLFDSKQLTDGAPPNDRGCRFCGKIGHIQKDCPKKKVNMEKREKKERQKDRRDVLRLANTEDEGEKQKKKAEDRSNEEDRETPSQDRSNQGQEGAAGTTVGGAARGKSPEGNLELNIPLKMMSKHCKKWESSLQYQRDGETLLGIKRHAIESFDEMQLEKGNVVCHIVPPMKNEQFVWIVDIDKAIRSISDKASFPIHSLYGYIIKTVEAHPLTSELLTENNAAGSCNFDLPENIGESLLEKIKEVAEIRRQKKRERMKVRYRREMAGPGYKRGKKFEVNGKGSDMFSIGSNSQLYSHPAADVYGNQKMFNKSHMALYSSKRNVNNKVSVVQMHPNTFQDPCSSSEDESYPTRAVRRKSKPKSNRDCSGGLHGKVHRDNINRGKGKIDGRTQNFMSREGAIKAKHQPSLRLTHKLVAIGPEKEIVTVSTDVPVASHQNARVLHNISQQSELPQRDPKCESILGRCGLVAGTAPGGAEPQLGPATNTVAGNAQARKKSHKSRVRRGKRGGSKLKLEGRGTSNNGNPINPE